MREPGPSLTARIRGGIFRVAFNPLVTGAIDRCWPAPSTGAQGERLAERVLRGKGMITVARNFRSRRGELDLVMVEDRQVVFVEVKCRTGTLPHENPAEAVDDAKQLAMASAAVDFLQQHQLIRCSCRFDVVAIRLDGLHPAVQHYRNAFESPIDW